MSLRIAFLSAAAAAFGAAALPPAASAADYYDGGQRPAMFHSRDDVFIDGDRARVEHSQDLRPGGAYGERRAPGPVVFDERGPDWRPDRSPYGHGGGYDGYRRPVVVERPAQGYRFGYGFGEGRPGAYGPRFDRSEEMGEIGYGAPYRPVPAYRTVSVPVDPEAYDGPGDRPDVGCTTQQAQSTTMAGWRKTVTQRTCYRR